MQLRLKEDPREWRKSVLLTVPAVALLSLLLCWRHVLPSFGCIAVVSLLVVVVAAAFTSPGWFRGYYRLSMRLGFALSQIIARVLLVLVFIVFITPLALLFRLLGKDALRLKRQHGAASYWVSARETSPLDRMF
jgi:uncharacterized membrane protein